MDYHDAVGLALVIVVYGSLIGGSWYYIRREKRLIRAEKLSGRLPARRSPRPRRSPPASSPLRSPVAAAFATTWALVPFLAWLLGEAVIRVVVPLEARQYIAPRPTLAQVLLYDVVWLLFWSGVVLLVWLLDWLPRYLEDPVVRRARELTAVGELVAAAKELQESIEASGPSIARWDALADILMKQGRWFEALTLSLDIEDRRRLLPRNGYRKALALCKLGVPEVAIAQLRPHDSNRVRRIDELCAYCQALADLGLFDRAWDQLRRAEVIYGYGLYPEAQGPRLREQIDACRSRLAVHFADKKPEGFEEF